MSATATLTLASPVRIYVYVVQVKDQKSLFLRWSRRTPSGPILGQRTESLYLGLGHERRRRIEGDGSTENN